MLLLMITYRVVQIKISARDKMQYFHAQITTFLQFKTILFVFSKAMVIHIFCRISIP